MLTIFLKTAWSVTTNFFLSSKILKSIITVIKGDNAIIPDLGVTRNELNEGLDSVRLINVEPSKQSTTKNSKQSGTKNSKESMTYTFRNQEGRGVIVCLYAIFNILMNTVSLIEFGKHKCVITTGVSIDEDGNEIHVTLHQNLLINNLTCVLYVLRCILKTGLNNLFNQYYFEDNLDFFKVKVWDMDRFANRDIKISNDNILISATPSKSFEMASIGHSEEDPFYYTPVKRDVITWSSKTPLTPPTNQKTPPSTTVPPIK
jgi:hypothetical protein